MYTLSHLSSKCLLELAPFYYVSSNGCCGITGPVPPPTLDKELLYVILRLLHILSNTKKTVKRKLHVFGKHLN
jgi:hypothetical protein